MSTYSNFNFATNQDKYCNIYNYIYLYNIIIFHVLLFSLLSFHYVDQITKIFGLF